MNYLSLVGRGTTGYREAFAPNSPLLADEGDRVSMSGVVGSTEQLQWRVWIPPGTRSLQATLFVYASPPESKVLLRMHQPPTGGLDSVTPENAAAVDLANVLELLLQGAEVPYYAPPVIAGNIKLSDGRMDSPIVTTTGGWLYINALQVPGAKIFELTAYTSVDKARYLNWYTGAIWDGQGNPVPGQKPVETHEQRVLKRATETGLVEALRRLSGGKSDADLIQAVRESGTWAALLAFAK